MKSPIARVAGVMAAALMAIGSQAALAQPGSGHGRGPGSDHGLAVEQVLASLKAQLNLNTSQQVMWDNAAAHGKAARASARGSMDQVHAAMKAELAKAEPDFAAVATIADQVQANNQAARKQVRDEWLRLYATFSPAQKAVVRDALRERLARMEAFRERMKERFQSRQGPTG
jgi:hypothetical protein